MKHTMILLFGLAAATVASAQLRAVDEGSSVKFTIDNFGFGVDGSFKGIQGTVDFDPKNAGSGHFDVSIDAATVNTDNSLRDSHLRNDSYFDVQNYPRIRLVSTRIISTEKAGTWQFTGQLTIKNISKEVSFAFTAEPSGNGLDFKGSFKIKRKDFNVGGSSTISNELTVSLNVIATK